MHTLAIDIETYSSVNIKSGIYKYATAPNFEILIIAYKIDNDSVKLFDLNNAETFLQLLQNPKCLKTAFNAPFERICLQSCFNIMLDPAQWECTMVKAYQCGMSGGLDQISQILRIGEKMKEGYSLMRYFCMPCKPTTMNGGRTRNLPANDPEKFAKFQQYCIKDVELESEIRRKLQSFEIPEKEKKLWILDQQINDRGMLIDKNFINSAIAIDQTNSAETLKKAIEITGLNNPRSTSQLKKWIETELEEEIEGIGKDKLPAILKKSKSESLNKLIELRKQMSKTSTAKYPKMLDMAAVDNRVRGLFQYYGASRTGRWAGRGIQLHNLPKNDMWDFDDPDKLFQARKLVCENDRQFLNICYEKPASVLSQLIRTCFIPPPGARLIITDLSAIEARIIAWLAGEKWRLDVFKTHGKIYEASASAMFNIPIESITKGSTIRYAGKVAELSLGYQGAKGALKRMLLIEKTKFSEQGKVFEYDPSDDELDNIVARWRLANPNIVQLWYATQSACFEALENPGSGFEILTDTYFQVRNNVLFIELPSGRKLCYLRPRIMEGKFGPCITYEGVDKSKKWERIETYGGKLVENITQAIARDVLAEKMLLLDQAGYKIVGHVHDEIIIESNKSHLIAISDIMSKPIDWAKDLPLAAETFETEFYRK